MSTLSVEVGDNIRSDLDSDSAEKTYPDLPIKKNDWSKHKEYVNLRLNYLKENDMKAYIKIKNKFPDLKPPSF